MRTSIGLGRGRATAGAELLSATWAGGGVGLVRGSGAVGVGVASAWAAGVAGGLRRGHQSLIVAIKPRTDGLAVVAEDSGQLHGGKPRPHANIAGIDMNETIWPAIIADAANLANQRAIPDLFDRDIGEIKVDCLADHVLAFLRHVTANPLQEGVGRGRAIAANDVNRLH
jgi:hypothetical protein